MDREKRFRKKQIESRVFSRLALSVGGLIGTGFHILHISEKGKSESLHRGSTSRSLCWVHAICNRFSGKSTKGERGLLQIVAMKRVMGVESSGFPNIYFVYCRTEMNYKGGEMKKDTVLSIRVPVPVRDKLSELAKSKGMTLAELIRSALSGLTWETEFERNIEYHQQAIKELRELQRVMRTTQRARSKAVTGKSVPPRKREQLNML